MCLQRKFVKEPVLKTHTQKEIDNLVQKKYARKLNAADLTREGMVSTKLYNYKPEQT